MNNEFLLNTTFLTAYSKLFRGCSDKYAKYSKGINGKKEYYPQSEPLSDGVRLDHLMGNHRIAVYPITDDNTCYFIAADLDDKKRKFNLEEETFEYWKRAEDLGLKS